MPLLLKQGTYVCNLHMVVWQSVAKSIGSLFTCLMDSK